MTLTFQAEPLTDAWPELVAMHYRNWQENESHRGPFEPLLERYLVHERLGGFVLFTARAGEKLVGSLGVFLIPSRHTQKLIASEDYLYLMPEYRRGRNAFDLISAAEKYCWDHGATEIEVTAIGDHVGALLRALDYEPSAVQYSKQRKRADSVRSLTAVNEASSHDAPSRIAAIS